MSAEWVTAIAGVGTLIVIAASAIAAMVQLRHIRSANQLSGLLHFTAAFQSDALQAANKFVATDLPHKLQDPNFVQGLLEANTDRRQHPELLVCDFMEQQGSYIKFGMIDKEQYIDITGMYVTSMWDQLRTVVAIRRVARNSGSIYENFEYLASVAKSTKVAPQRFPGGVAVLMPEDEWRRIGNAYANAHQPQSRSGEPK